MTIACSKCGRVHTLPEGASDNKRLSFFCSQCGHRVVVDGRRNFVAGTTGTASFKEAAASPSISSLLESTSCLFSVQTFLVSTLFSIVAFLLLSSVSFVIVKNASFFLSNRLILALLGATTAALLIYGYGIVLYLIAKIRYYKIDHPHEESVDWKFILFDFHEDSITLFVFFVCIPFLVLLLSLPVCLLDDGGILYSGLAFPFIMPLALFCVILFTFLRIVPAALAAKALYFRQAVSSLKKFAIREALHIPVYAVLIDMIASLISLIVLSFFWLAIFATLAVFASFLDPSITGQFKTLASSGFLQLSGISAMSDISFAAKAGTLLIAFFLLVSVLLSFSFVITVRQNLTAQACWIMYSNPGKSIPKYVLVLIFTACALVFASMLWTLPFVRLLFR